MVLVYQKRHGKPIGRHSEKPQIENFTVGLAPLVIGLFFFSSVQLIFIGIAGEYISAIWTQAKNTPLVIEEERINF